MKHTTITLLLFLLSGCGTPPPPRVSIEEARNEAYSRYLECRVQAASNHDDGLEAQGTLVPGKKGRYAERVPGAFEKLRQQQNFDNSECRKIYEAELGLIQPHAVTEQEELQK